VEAQVLMSCQTEPTKANALDRAYPEEIRASRPLQQNTRFPQSLCFSPAEKTQLLMKLQLKLVKRVKELLGETKARIRFRLLDRHSIPLLSKAPLITKEEIIMEQWKRTENSIRQNCRSPAKLERHREILTSTSN
jgi:hypothetical protein